MIFSLPHFVMKCYKRGTWWKIVISFHITSNLFFNLFDSFLWTYRIWTIFNENACHFRNRLPKCNYLISYFLFFLLGLNKFLSLNGKLRYCDFKVSVCLMYLSLCPWIDRWIGECYRFRAWIENQSHVVKVI